MKRGTPDHPKTHALAAALGLERWGAVGVLEALFHFTAAYARRGDIGRHPNVAIARGIGWSGDAEKLIAALVESGWLNRCACHRLRVHDWHEHADQTVSRSEEVKRAGFITCYKDASSTLVSDAGDTSQPTPLPTPLPLPLPTPLPGARSLRAVGPSANGNGSRMDSDDRVEYGKAVWETFCTKHGISRGGTSAEWNLISKWMDAGHVLAIVLRGIEETGGKPRTLHACERAVDEAVARWASAAGLITA